jgi:hypothetical protein
MEVTADLELSPEEQNQLALILGCEVADLALMLGPYASAALKEHVSMFLGQSVFTRGSDLLEYRLLLLIQYALNGRIPDEQAVCNLFQVTSSGSRSLIRAVMSKYQYQLRTAIEDTVKRLIESAKLDTTDLSVTVAVHNLNLVDELNRALAELDTNLPPVQKKRGSVSTFELQRSSYEKLCTKFDLQAKGKVE